MKFTRLNKDKMLYDINCHYRRCSDNFSEGWDEAYSHRLSEENQHDQMLRERQSKSEVLPFIRNNIPNNKDIKILELACGVANYSMELIENGYDVWLSDYSQILVDKILKPNLSRSGRDPEKAFAADMTDLSNLKAEYDVVVLVGAVYEHRDAAIPEKTYKEIQKVLKPGGLFLHVLNKYKNGIYSLLDYLPVRVFKNLFFLPLGLKELLRQRLSYISTLRRVLSKPPMALPSLKATVFWFYGEEDIKRMLTNSGFQIEKIEFMDTDIGIGCLFPFAFNGNKSELNKIGKAIKSVCNGNYRLLSGKIGFVCRKITT